MATKKNEGIEVARLQSSDTWEIRIAPDIKGFEGGDITVEYIDPTAKQMGKKIVLQTDRDKYRIAKHTETREDKDGNTTYFTIFHELDKNANVRSPAKPPKDTE